MDITKEKKDFIDWCFSGDNAENEKYTFGLKIWLENRKIIYDLENKIKKLESKIKRLEKGRK